KSDRGTTRFYRILISESAHLIWRLKNERVINGKDPPAPAEIKNRWVYGLNVRLTIDCLMTNKAKYGKKALKKGLVLRTWGTCLRWVILQDFPVAHCLII
ncbi:hypothetical protein B0H13DRAFT_1457660, partial [Mycena leptocephala]